MFRIILIILMVFLFSSCGFSQFIDLRVPSGDQIKVKVSVSSNELAKGLSKVPSLEAFQGMLFIFDKPKQANFWMKEMMFDLDIIFLDENKKVLEIRANEVPCQTINECPIIQSKNTAIKYVLEVPAGMATQYQINNDSILKW
ncbi:DUF192 domain-containing protein [Candidatus Falkowbacteria bacterium]|jgi:uncharacterized protein|nr:DUF192 domain-containing protein [Candidatus Falkowbacteria bacterium]MBT5503075.1 DUF192 domain-containing protein [Candidatus Falkowbacteria bacterium]MBT6573914.1 DUF192 domain-containing protein [Candidatus Falkowbacteria bacterium]MBT7348325.1 DUF192 domain-containing protein [Candidatus Falkowbacteria bacterium]MBT7500292.1 DUF192 domain-containing protein [Candidatus Falkowbacteria bacterium]